MKDVIAHRESFGLQRIVLFGSVASSSVIFSVLLLLFLASRSTHPGYSTDTISEMMGYAEFFFFAFSSYFAASIVVWYCAEYFSRLSASWLPIVIFGSVAFSVSFLLRVWISSVLTYQEGNPFQNGPPNFRDPILSIIIIAGICLIVSSISCRLVYAVTRPDSEKSEISP